MQIWRHYVGGLIATNRYFPHQQYLLLDGVPRTLRQAELFAPFLNILKIIVIDTPNLDVLIKRLQRRAFIEHRQDDTNEQILRTRMQVYQKETLKVLDFYPQELICRFNADQRPLEVLRDVLSELCGLLSYTEEE